MESIDFKTNVDDSVLDLDAQSYIFNYNKSINLKKCDIFKTIRHY